MSMTNHDCKHDYETEQAETAQREAHENGECRKGCPYCAEDQDRADESLGG